MIDLLKKSVLEDKLIEDSISLMSGRSGVMLTCFIAGSLLNDSKLTEHGYSQITRIIELLGSEKNSASFGNGVSGAGWAINFLIKNKLVENNADELLKSIDHIIENNLSLKIKNKSARLDFLNGALGMGVYLLNRGYHNHSSIKELVKYILFLSKDFDKEKIYWESYTSKNRIVVNFGLAHGMTAIINFLIFFRNQNGSFLSDQINSTILKAFNFMEYFKSKSEYWIYPAYLTSKFEPIKSRLAWCYGDLNIAYSYLLYSDLEKEAHFENLAKEILTKTLTRKSTSETNILDTSFCHGTAGLLYLYNQLNKRFSSNNASSVMQYWYEKTMNFNDAKSIDNFRYLDNDKELVLDSSILNGTSGILLSVLDYLNEDSKFDFKNMFVLGH